MRGFLSCQNTIDFELLNLKFYYKLIIVFIFVLSVSTFSFKRFCKRKTKLDSYIIRKFTSHEIVHERHKYHHTHMFI